MKALSDGGSAFPSHGSMGEVAQEGMSLRDYFAGQVLAGIVTLPSDGFFDNELSQMRAAIAYQIADAMIAESARERGEGEAK